MAYEGAAGSVKTTLAEFIQENLEAILVEWESFARTIVPVTKGMSVEKLRDHAREMLTAIAIDMQTRQSSGQQQAKSEGRRWRISPEEDSPAETHTVYRLTEGFTLDEVVSEYRALRASVIRLWTRVMGQADRTHLDELTRFNEALDEAVSESVARYTERMERGRDLLLGALGHDLRNPLGAVLQSAHFLLQTQPPDSPQTKAAALIVSSGTRMKTMIADLLDFASTKLDDLLPVSVVPMDMGGACHAAAEEIAALYPARKVDVESRGELSGRWDPARIAQLLSNLLGNAVKHGAADRPIRLSAVGSEHWVHIEIHNQGRPIPEQQRATLFAPLTRGAMQDVENPTSDRSVGLGLYIATEIAKAHGGKLELARSDDNGTTFVATLPRKSA
jgi:signal transduction histidine kinase